MDITSSQFAGLHLPANVTQAYYNISRKSADTMEYDTSNISYPINIKTTPLWEAIIKIFFYTIIIVVAFTGNLLVILIVWKNKRMRTTTNYYLVNLAVSDLLVTLSCTWVHLVDDLTENWVLGAFFCKINSFAQVLALVSSILTLTLIACDRFFGIVFAMKAHVAVRKAKLFIALVWLIAIAISSPLLIYREQGKRQWLDHVEIWCADTWSATTQSDDVTGHELWQPSRKIYYTVVSIMLYLMPILVMSVAYTFIMWKLWVTSTPGEQLEAGVMAKNRLKKRVILMLMFILVVFAVCWLPFQISIFYAEYRPHQYKQLPTWYTKFNFFANYMAFANSAFNPIIYTGFNANFRRGFKTLFEAPRQKTARSRTLYSTLAQATPHSKKNRFASTSISANNTPANPAPTSANSQPPPTQSHSLQCDHSDCEMMNSGDLHCGSIVQNEVPKTYESTQHECCEVIHLNCCTDKQMVVMTPMRNVITTTGFSRSTDNLIQTNKDSPRSLD